GDGSPEAGVTDDGEFGLKVSYSINGSPDRDAYIQFCDITEPVDAAEGVTFEIGRQYVLNLTFGAGSDPDDPDPDINIGAKISFSELGVDGYDRDVNVPKMESDSWPEFSQSNIYYNNSLGVETLTFSEKEDGKNLYQGLFFKYGSLIGISAGASSTFFNASTYLFIPNLSTGKYSKVQVSELDNYNGSDPAVEEFIEVLEDNSFTDWGGTDDGYGGTTYSGLYAALPFVADGDVPANGSGRNENGLTVHSDASLYAQYKGDICKFMSYNSSASGLSGKWRLPVSSEFGPNRSDYTESANWSGSFTGGVSVDGTDKLAADYSFYTFSRVLTGTGKPSFPASGSTLYGTLTQVGFFGLYWSSSARNETDAYRLSIASGGSVNLNNGSGRSYGGSVRCVRE
ncbi:MAG: hypothetical protein LBR26_00485, partial [Prevotella sp.]|nr:hypothetical protein [Prevotella sp.]